MKHLVSAVAASKPAQATITDTTTMAIEKSQDAQIGFPCYVSFIYNGLLPVWADLNVQRGHVLRYVLCRAMVQVVFT